MNVRFYNAKILKTNDDKSFEIIEGQLWVKGSEIVYIGPDKRTDNAFKDNNQEMIIWDKEIDVCGNLLMPGFKNAHTHTAMTFLRSFADDLPLKEWLFDAVFPREGQLEAQDIYDLDILGIMPGTII